jgi:hypothetical protein
MKSESNPDGVVQIAYLTDTTDEVYHIECAALTMTELLTKAARLANELNAK